MAVRQHLYALQREKLVTAEERRVPIGRPAKYWRLTREADTLFPDAYAELNVALIDAVLDDVRPAAGCSACSRRAEAKQRAEYSARISRSGAAQDAAAAAGARAVRRRLHGRGEAGRPRHSFSSSRTTVRFARPPRRVRDSARPSSISFGAVLGPGVAVERTEHVVSGDRRCVYTVSSCDERDPRDG